MEIRKNRRVIEWGKNFLIFLLSLSAVYLMSQSTLHDGLGTLSGTESNQESGWVQREYGETLDQRISIEPVCLAVQNEVGRYGIQYDQQTTDELFEAQLGSLLREALGGTKLIFPTTETQWKLVLGGNTRWIYYDFYSELPLFELSTWLGNETDQPVLFGTARYFLLAESESTGRSVLYFRNEEDGTYYCCELAEGGEERFQSVIKDFSPNGAKFAFEEQGLSGILADEVMVLPELPKLQEYEVRNPLSLKEEEREELLRSLSFNPLAVSLYQAADGVVIREGFDTLRILNQGTILYKSLETQPVRYQVNDDFKSILDTTQKILTVVIGNRCGEAKPYLISIHRQEDGSVIVSYGYQLNGAPVQVYKKVHAAQFIIRDGSVCDFTIHVRQYESLNQQVLVLPETQVAAAAKAIGQEGKDVMLMYLDSGEDSRITASWIAH